MKRVLTALILIPVALGLVFFTSRFQWIFTLAVAAIAALAGWEILGLAQRGGARPPRVAVLVFGTLLALVPSLSPATAALRVPAVRTIPTEPALKGGH